MNSTAFKDINENENNENLPAEGPVAKAIEKQTAKLPSDTFLWLALSSMAASLALQVKGRKEVSNFLGHWVPTLLILGLYNKVVKVAGSDRKDNDENKSRNKEAA